MTINGNSEKEAVRLKENIDTAYIFTNLSGKGLMILGTSTNGRSFLLNVTDFDNKRAKNYVSPDVSFIYNNNADIVYLNNPSYMGEFTINVSQIDALNLSGTFYGRVKDSLSNDKQIIEGRFHTNYFTP